MNSLSVSELNTNKNLKQKNMIDFLKGDGMLQKIVRSKMKTFAKQNNVKTIVLKIDLEKPDEEQFEAEFYSTTGILYSQEKERLFSLYENFYLNAKKQAENGK